ncbi:MAG TPA: TldD/PmbA family protein [Candidatus Dormibacteraeota bacterium]|nr:TldD/PmbA family protein [Candidatus Dormibacteraeota bacterium]
MDESQALAFAQDAVALATANGAGSAEATVSIARRFHVEARAAEIAKLEASTGKSLHVRVFTEGRRATLVTSDFSRDALTNALAHTVDQARYMAADPYAYLPDACAGYLPDLALYDRAVAERDDAEKVADALALERQIRDADPRVTNSSGSEYSDAMTIVALANSKGFAGSYSGTRASRASAPVATDGPHKRTAQYGTAARSLHELESVSAVAKVAARRAVELFGARTPKTMQLPVIFERDVAAAVLGDLFAAISAANVAVGDSWLADRIGDRIGSDFVTMYDDGRLPGRLGSAPFDGEGVATQRTAIFERGVLRTFLYDSYYARKLGATTTGNSTGGGIGVNSFFLESGRDSLEDLIASTPRGVLVLDTIGFATEHASGIYSRGARGFYIEGGELAYPIDEFTIAGHFGQMLAGMDGVANDLRFDGSVVAPSFRVAEMTISGN